MGQKHPAIPTWSDLEATNPYRYGKNGLLRLPGTGNETTERLPAVARYAVNAILSSEAIIRPADPEEIVIPEPIQRLCYLVVALTRELEAR